MTVTKQKQGTWKVDVSDGFNPLTGQQKRTVATVKRELEQKKKLKNMKQIIV